MGEAKRRHAARPPGVSEANAEIRAVIAKVRAAVAMVAKAGAPASMRPLFFVEDTPWKANDRHWFATRPSRAHRLRRVAPGEFADELRLDVPDGYEPRTLIRQTQPGMRIRLPVLLRTELADCDTEELLHALFDQVLAEAPGTSIDGRRVAELARIYLRAKDYAPA